MSCFRLTGSSRKIVSGLASLSRSTTLLVSKNDVASCQSVVRTASSITSRSISSTTIPNQSSKMSIAGGMELASLRTLNPHIDVVKYAHKNRVWTLNHVDYYSEALAIGLLENGLRSGDVILSWLPDHFSEQMVLQFACSKAGFVLYSLNPEIAVTDPESSKAGLKAALEMTSANVLISQEAGSDVNYIRLAESVIPELRIFDYSEGMPFITPRFPDVRFCIHTGFDQDNKFGWLPLRQMVVPSNNLEQYVAPNSLRGSTLLAGTFVLDGKGIPTGLGKTYTNEEVRTGDVWSTYRKVLNKEYHQVDGVGVIF